MTRRPKRQAINKPSGATNTVIRLQQAGSPWN